MDKLIEYIGEIDKLNNKSFREVFDEFKEFSNQDIPEEVYSEWIFTGLNNKDFLFSDFLLQFGYNNIYYAKK